jgi:transcriptional regulator with XRE-family HTH domain
MAIAFGDTLKSLRTGKNMSQQQLADKLFVNRSSIANWENGRRLPDLVLLHRIATFFNVDISTLTDVAIQDQAPPEVIIVDDETILLAGVIPILSEVMPGATITGFSKPSEAISYAKKNRVSIAFLDIEMGKTSGLELCNTLMEINPTTNVIFLTSYPDYAVRAWETTASGFVVKPLHKEDVVLQLQKMRYPVAGLMGETT